ARRRRGGPAGGGARDASRKTPSHGRRGRLDWSPGAPVSAPWRLRHDPRGSAVLFCERNARHSEIARRTSSERRRLRWLGWSNLEVAFLNGKTRRDAWIFRSLLGGARRARHGVRSLPHPCADCAREPRPLRARRRRRQKAHKATLPRHAARVAREPHGRRRRLRRRLLRDARHAGASRERALALGLRGARRGHLDVVAPSLAGRRAAAGGGALDGFEDEGPHRSRARRSDRGPPQARKAPAGARPRKPPGPRRSHPFDRARHAHGPPPAPASPRLPKALGRREDPRRSDPKAPRKLESHPYAEDAVPDASEGSGKEVTLG